MNSPFMHHLRTEADLDTALACLVKLDPRFTRALALSGRPPLRKRPDGFAGLVAIVVAQQLSTASASAILERLKAALDPLDHAAVLRASASRRRRSARSRRSLARSLTARSTCRASPTCRPTMRIAR
jgi:DNA-3-methyladenine glycosylase II